MPPSVHPKWGLHATVLAIVGAFVALVVAVLFSAGRGPGLDGLGAALAGVSLVIAFALYAVVSTVIVALVRNRRDVAQAHALTLGGFLIVVALMIATN